MAPEIQRSHTQDCIRLQTPAADSAMIWLHGLGATNEDFVPVFKRIVSALSLNCIGLFPQAPTRPVTFSAGMPMPCWYDILGASPKRIINEEDLHASAQRIQSMINDLQNEGIAADRIFIAGFSQGGAVAYETALTFDKPLAGLICLSTYLGRPVSPADTSLPVFCAHGTRDDVVPLTLGKNTRDELNAMGLTAQWQTYPIQHEVSLPEIADITDFVSHQLAKS
ncbi:MAG: carboxylesterase [Oceanospirillaceae bacterium]|nr:carboxylesterase [Oceanospirillaceae bacterium]MBT13759.1 carboxylesterase [Oceanospirillaceae bacterium]|tara:strand:+ start:26893 stop:27564 length:672 start_codon:yes stop_codon:yes gene_type:complete